MPTNVVVVVVESLQPNDHIDQLVDVCSSYKVFKFVKKWFYFCPVAGMCCGWGYGNGEAGEIAESASLHCCGNTRTTVEPHE